MKKVQGAKALTPVMKTAILFAKEHGGKIIRYPGGFWSNPQNYSTTFGTSTIEALVKRGFMSYSEWQDGRRGKFPIEAMLTEKPIAERVQ